MEDVGTRPKQFHPRSRRTKRKTLQNQIVLDMLGPGKQMIQCNVCDWNCKEFDIRRRKRRGGDLAREAATLAGLLLPSWVQGTVKQMIRLDVNQCHLLQPGQESCDRHEWRSPLSARRWWREAPGCSSVATRWQKPSHREEGFNGEPPEVGEAGSVDKGGGDGCEREEGGGQVDLLDNC